MIQNPPKDTPRITPHLFYNDVGMAMDWLVRAFGFAVRLRMVDKNGTVVHGELEVADSLVMLGLTIENPSWISPQNDEGRICQRLYIYVDDADEIYTRALRGGARMLYSPADQFYGDRVFECADLEGHRWKFAQHLWDVDTRNLKRPEDS